MGASPSPRGRALRVALWLLVALLAARLAVFSAWAATRLSNGFAAHYTASRLLLDGADVARFYDDGWFAARVGDLAGPVYDLFRPNPPTASLLLAPVAWLDYAGARVTWTLLSLAALAGTALFLIRQSRLEGPWRPAFLAGILLFQPVYEQVAQGQNYLLMLALLALTWHGYRRGSPLLTGVSLGLALALKLLGGCLLLLLLLERRWRALAWAAGTGAALALVSVPWIGPNAWLVYVGEIPEFLRQPDLAITAHQTQAGFLQHMFAFDPRYNPAPLLDAAGLAPVLVWTAFSIVLCASLYTASLVPGTDLAFALMLMLNLILGPLSVDYQYTVMLLPIALLLSWARGRHSTGCYLLFAAGLALIAADLPYRSPRLSAGIWALLAYPKLYGAWILWGMAAWGSVSSRRSRAIPRPTDDRTYSPVLELEPTKVPRRSWIMKVSARMGRLGMETAFDVLNQARELEAQGKSIIHLEIGEPDFDTPACIVKAGQEALGQGYTHYGPSQGMPELREAIAAESSKARGVPCSASQVVVTPGAKPIMFYAMMMLAEEGDEVITPDPGFPIYQSTISFAGATPVPLVLREELDFSIDLDELRSKITPKTTLLILNTPQNPTGGVVPAEQLEEIAKLAVEHDLWVLSDEVYRRILYRGEHVSISSFPGMAERTIVLDGYSKTYAMTGWRLGYAIAPEALVPHFVKLANNDVSCTASFIQRAALACPEAEEDVAKMVAEFAERRKLVVEGLNAIDGISCRWPSGAFYAFPNVKGVGVSSKEFASYLLYEMGVATLSGTAFGAAGDGYLRLSYANSQANLGEALRRIEAGVKRLKG